MLRRGKGVLGTLHLLFPAIAMHGSFDLFPLAFMKSSFLDNMVDTHNPSFTVSETSRIMCFVFQAMLLLSGLLHCEQIYKELNIWQLSAAVRATDETDGVSCVNFELSEEDDTLVKIMVV